MPKNDCLDPDKIKANLKTNRIGSKILVYSSTSSTNDIASEYAKNSRNDGLAIFAEEQIAGRGRNGAKWVSKAGQSVLCSIVLTAEELPAELLSLIFAVAVAEAIGEVGGNQAKIKWSNDIILNGKKLAGILIESKPVNHGNSYVIGIGINCHQTRDSFPPELQPVATSIDLEGRTVCDRTSLSKRLLTSIDHWLEQAKQAPEKVIEQWRNLSIRLAHRVTLVYNGRKFTGNCISVDPEKGLTIRLDSGAIRMFDAAHTSIVKQ